MSQIMSQCKLCPKKFKHIVFKTKFCWILKFRWFEHRILNLILLQVKIMDIPVVSHHEWWNDSSTRSSIREYIYLKIISFNSPWSNNRMALGHFCPSNSIFSCKSSFIYSPALSAWWSFSDSSSDLGFSSASSLSYL